MDPAQGDTNSKQVPPQPPSSGDWKPPPPDWSQQPVSQDPPPLKAPTRQDPLSRGPFSTVPVPDAPVKPPLTPQIPTENQSVPLMSVVPTPAPSVIPPPQLAPNPPLTAPSMEIPTVPPLIPVAPTVQGGSPEGKSKKGSGKLFLVIFLILLIIVSLGAAGYFYFYMQQPTVTSEPEVSPVASSSVKPTTLVKGKLLYVRNNNVFSYNLSSNQETQLTQDGSEVNTYRLPKWVDDNRMSLVRCGDKSADGKSPYTCYLYTQQLTGNTPVEIASVSSQPNTSGIHLGDIKTYAWDSKKKQVAYLIDEYTDKNTVTKLYYKSDASISATVLKEFAMTGGRGGSPDDSVYLEFSPDGEKLLLNFTWIYPSSPDRDEGTLFVFDLPSKQLVWKMANTWTSNAHFLSGHILFAKQQSTATESAGIPSQAVWIDLIKFSIDPKDGITKIAETPSWYGFEPLNKEMAVFYSVATESGKGVALEELNLTTKSKKLLKEQLLPVKVIDETSLVVWTMKKCSENGPEESCGMDIYNGYLTDGIGVFDTDAKSVRNLSLASPSGILLSEFDYLE